MVSIGEAPYEWTIETDVLAWGANAADVLMVGSLAAKWGCDYLQGVLIGLASLERPWGGAVQADRRKTSCP